jgi:hypothetical protein
MDLNCEEKGHIAKLLIQQQNVLHNIPSLFTQIAPFITEFSMQVYRCKAILGRGLLFTIVVNEAHLEIVKDSLRRNGIGFQFCDGTRIDEMEKLSPRRKTSFERSVTFDEMLEALSEDEVEDPNLNLAEESLDLDNTMLRQSERTVSLTSNDPRQEDDVRLAINTDLNARSASANVGQHILNRSFGDSVSVKTNWKSLSLQIGDKVVNLQLEDDGERLRPQSCTELYSSLSTTRSTMSSTPRTPPAAEEMMATLPKIEKADDINEVKKADDKKTVAFASNDEMQVGKENDLLPKVPANSVAEN